MRRNRSVDTHRFAMVPRPEVPRSSFQIQHTHKTTFNAGYLVPIYVDEVLPGDTFNLHVTAFARLATPLFPVMDNLHLDTFFFFVPNRLLWSNWVRMMGEQPNPDDSTDFLVPQVSSPLGGWPVHSIGDYFGLPTVGQVDPAATVPSSALPFRAYNLIYNEWFRDQNLQDRVPFGTGDGPDVGTDYVLKVRGKRHDYFTSCLPWPQKGDSVALPLGNTAPVIVNPAQPVPFLQKLGGGGTTSFANQADGDATFTLGGAMAPASQDLQWADPALLTDLSAATAATINQLRQSFQIQKLLERDARGGTRYTELVRSHFGVVSPDARLQRPEYLGGGHSPIIISPIAQTSATGAYADAPLGTLGAMGTAALNQHGFSQSFTEHGFVIGLVCVRADLTYQQGMRRMWSRRTRFDHYWPAFAHLGEQAVLNKEIFFSGDAVQDNGVFGYQERWSEYRYNPSQITSLFRSTTSGTLDGWHLAQKFNNLPVLNDTFISESPPVERVLAVGAAANGAHLIADFFFNCRAARPLPAYSVPGLIDHF